MKFLKNLFTVILGTILGLIILFGVFGIIISIASADKPAEVKENSVLNLTLDKPISERTVENPFGDFFGGEETLGLLDIRRALEHAREDDKIKGVYLGLKGFSSGISQSKELRDALLDFKSSGKFIVAYGEYISENAYYLASTADEIYLHPQGGLDFNGFSFGVSYYQDMLEKIEVKMQVFRPSSNYYKSAVEPFMRSDMSDSNRVQLTALQESVEATLMKDISDSRGIPVSELIAIADSMKIRRAGDAISYEMISDTLYWDQVDAVLREKIGLDDDEKKIEFVSVGTYNDSYKSKKKSKNRIAVIFGQGGINSGKSDDNSIGSDDYAALIRKARKDEKVKAVVLRVNSPGGSALASDVIWREVVETSKVKPVIASMSDLAASGGYYISMAADTIVAEPTTITGSIGIFGVIPDISGLMENKLGITSDRVNSGVYSDFFDVSRPMRDDEKAIVQKFIDEGYENFTQKAAMGRGMSWEDLLKLAGGRVWTGQDALDRGLVDVLGGLDDAVAIAAEKAGVSDDFRIVNYPEQKDFWEQIMTDFGSAKASIVEEELGEYYQHIQLLREVEQMQGIQARMPFVIEID